jgi:hypothetical protein
MVLYNGTTIEGKFVCGLLEGKCDVHNSQGETITVDEFAQVQGMKMEYLVPPFFPFLN